MCWAGMCRLTGQFATALSNIFAFRLTYSLIASGMRPFRALLLQCSCIASSGLLIPERFPATYLSALPTGGLKWTRTTDITLIRRAL